VGADGQRLASLSKCRTKSTNPMKYDVISRDGYKAKQQVGLVWWGKVCPADIAELAVGSTAVGMTKFLHGSLASETNCP